MYIHYEKHSTRIPHDSVLSGITFEGADANVETRTQDPLFPELPAVLEGEWPTPQTDKDARIYRHRGEVFVSIDGKTGPRFDDIQYLDDSKAFAHSLDGEQVAYVGVKNTHLANVCKIAGDFLERTIEHVEPVMGRPIAGIIELPVVMLTNELVGPLGLLARGQYSIVLQAHKPWNTRFRRVHFLHYIADRLIGIATDGRGNMRVAIDGQLGPRFNRIYQAHPTELPADLYGASHGLRYVGVRRRHVSCITVPLP